MQLLRLSEPKLLFGHDQSLEDPRDGLTLFGPLDSGKTFGIRPAVIGTPAGIERFWRWVESIRKPINDGKPSRPPFPGFEAVFDVPFGNALFQFQVEERELLDACHIRDRHQRVHRVVHLYRRPDSGGCSGRRRTCRRMVRHRSGRGVLRCRPHSVVPAGIGVTLPTHLGAGIKRLLLSADSIFPELNQDVIPYRFQPHFRNQLKAVLLEAEVPTQVIRESTLAPNDFLNRLGRPLRRVGYASEIAWNLSTTAFYKTGARPWKVAQVREGVCYLGLVFKRDETTPDGRWSSCGAQMFLDSGDGLVFRGTGGPWYSPAHNSYHLDEPAAQSLVELAVKSYRAKNGTAPRELFIHGKARFDEAEWRGFVRGAPDGTQFVGVRIRLAEDLRIYRPGRLAILRGLAFVRDQRTAFLWANGFIPRLWTYPGREVPKALLVDVCRGRADIRTVLKDVLALTKLNYNACIYGDGQPVTLKFADAVERC